MQPKEGHVSVLLVGKSGSGKSSVGNALLAKSAFQVGSGFDTTTNICQVDSNDGLTVADTPDLSAVIYNDQEAVRTLQPAFDQCSSGFNAILLVMRLDVRLTEEEIGVANLVQRLFGDGASSNIVLVFTHSEWVESDEAFRSLVERQRSSFPALDKLMRECGERCVMLNGGGRCSSERLESERKRLMELVQQMDRTVSKNQSEGYNFNNRQPFRASQVATAESSENEENCCQSGWSCLVSSICHCFRGRDYEAVGNSHM